MAPVKSVGNQIELSPIDILAASDAIVEPSSSLRQRQTQLADGRTQTGAHLEIFGTVDLLMEKIVVDSFCTASSNFRQINDYANYSLGNTNRIWDSRVIHRTRLAGK